MPTRVLQTGSSLARSLGSVPAPPRLATAVASSLRTADDAVSSATLMPATARSWRDKVGSLAAQLADDTDHVHTLDLPSALAALQARRESRSRVVVRAQLAQPTAAGPAAALWPVVVRAADAVVAPTSADADAAVSLGADRRRVVVCPDAALVAAQVAAAGGEPGTRDDDAPYVLGLSGAPHDPLVRGELLRVLVVQPGLRLVLAAPSDDDLPDRRQLLQQARRAGVLERVQVLGRLTEAELAGVVDGARLVLATRSDPTCALAPLVAMHRARAVVGVRSTSTADVVVDGVTGLVTEGLHGVGLADAVTQLVRDDFRCLAWGVAGQDRVTNRYAPERVGQALVAVHEVAAA